MVGARDQCHRSNHRALDRSRDGEVRGLCGDAGDAVSTALSAFGGRLCPPTDCRQPLAFLLELELPVLPNQVFPKAVMPVFVDQTISRGYVDAPGRTQHAVGPQDDAAVPGQACEAGALLHEPGADPQSSRAWLDQEQAELPHGARLANEKHAADVETV